MSPAALITQADRIFIAGHRGMAGSAIYRALDGAGYTQQLTASRQQLDLLDTAAVEAWFNAQRPDVIGDHHYHGNPVFEEGSLVYRYPARQLMDDLRQAGFHDAVNGL